MANENKVINFIDEVDKEKRKIASQSAFMNSPIYKKKQLENNIAKAKTDCLEYIFSDLYQRSLPLDDSYINANGDKLVDDMKDFINRQTANRGIECYMKEAIKHGNRSAEKIMESVDRLVGNCFREKVVNYQKLDVKDLDWKFDDDKKASLDRISKDANLDEVSRVIRQNVKAAAEYERDKIRQRKEETKSLQEELEKNDNMTSESAIDSFIKLRKISKGEPKVYQPSLFEGVMIGKFNQGDTNTIDGQIQCYNEAVGEYTLLNITKALKVKDYSLRELRTMAKEYSRT